MVVTDKMSIHLTSVIETLYQILHFLKKRRKNTLLIMEAMIMCSILFIVIHVFATCFQLRDMSNFFSSRSFEERDSYKNQMIN